MLAVDEIDDENGRFCAHPAMQPRNRSIMNKISLRIVVLSVLASATLSGCATTGSVKRAQSSADEAMSHAREGVSGAQRAQASADAAASSAQHSQTSADDALAVAQGATALAQSIGTSQQATDRKLASLESRIGRLEKWKRTHTHHKKSRRRHKAK
jgi:hypothetical protein